MGLSMGSIFSISQSVHQTRDFNSLKSLSHLITTGRKPGKLHIPIQNSFLDYKWVRDPAYHVPDKAIALAEVIKRVVRGNLDFNGVLMHVPSTCVGFRAHRDLSTKFHLTVFPYRFIPTVHDLTPDDLFLVMSLVKHSREYVWNNWGSYSGLQMGFLKDAEIGYLHMHVLLGPLTEYGWSKRHDWVSVDQVLDILAHN